MKKYSLEEARAIIASEKERVHVALKVSKDLADWIDSHASPPRVGAGAKSGRAGFVRDVLIALKERAEKAGIK